ncbi:MAG: helix-turn-helix domain-containing protein [Microcystis sp. LE19-195.1E]|jgi:hypothetical protein|nr:helix-turn-helix domain-containing protein [Microcystis sp. LE19-195.1E]
MLTNIRFFAKMLSGVYQGVTTMHNEPFTQAAQQWDLQTLYADLTFAKGKPLTPVEKTHLRGLLCGCSPSEIAEKLHKNPNGVETDLCATVYRYVKNLLDKNNGRIDNWRNITQWLEEAGYKHPSAEIPMTKLLPEQSVANITNVTVETTQVVIHFNLAIPTSNNMGSYQNESEKSQDAEKMDT